MSWRLRTAPLFDPAVLHVVARGAVGLPHDKMVRQVAEELEQRYPGHIESRPNWMLSICGGVLGIMTVLHGSLSEYVVIFGTPVGSEGFSGRYRLEIHDFMLAGEMWTYTESDFAERRVYRAGDAAVLARREAKGVRILEGAWMLEYGRGPVPSALPFALSGAITALELRTIVKTIGVYGRLVLRELAQGKI
ncbi:MAG TPA: isomerase [Methylomirabilota bacterium]|nr:isomerase [Methylomirabilota bacterium]